METTDLTLAFERKLNEVTHQGFGIIIIVDAVNKMKNEGSIAKVFHLHRPNIWPSFSRFYVAPKKL